MAKRTEITQIRMRDTDGAVFEVERAVDFTSSGLVGGPSTERPMLPKFWLGEFQLEVRDTGEFVHAVSGKLMRKV